MITRKASGCVSQFFISHWPKQLSWPRAKSMGHEVEEKEVDIAEQWYHNSLVKRHSLNALQWFPLKGKGGWIEVWAWKEIGKWEVNIPSRSIDKNAP